MRSSVAAIALPLVFVATACSSGTHRSAPTTSTRSPSTTVASPTTAPAGRARASTTQPVVSAARPCGARTLSSARYRHVIWVWMENHSYVIGSSSAPYENELAALCGVATNYHNLTHPSLPNYIGATSGLAYGGLAQFASDCSPSKSCSTTAPSIFGQVPSWKAYEESMPARCSMSNSRLYAVRHNPPPYFTGLAGCSANDVPYTQLASDLAGNALPAFAFITPNLNDDTHDAPIATGDAWLRQNIPSILSSVAYRQGTVAIFITWDEGEGGTANQCATNTTDIGCRVATIVISPTTQPGTRSATLFNHYSLLRTAEQLLGVPPLQLAATASSMATAFNL